MKYHKGFTLIELLVVIAIIGILSSVVLASLNTARTKGQIAAIKSNLKNIIAQAELAYDGPGNYSTVCGSSRDPKIDSMITAINNSGGTADCFSFGYTGYISWGASAHLNSDSTQNFSVSSTGVVTWDTANKTSSDWATANVNCAAAGGRLPSIEELKSLYLAYDSVPPNSSFSTSSYYWSGTTIPSVSTLAYDVSMYNGNVYSVNKTDNLFYVRCVH
ncbi:MAG: DUF1566 domain-containing protein [Candidatus Pacebacteria bacterium]|nr:DUF1566 domain-containing protein [Candidatus Paceibacterota bacterium]